MEYIIAGIRIDIPHDFAAGAFGMALAPFAAKGEGYTPAMRTEAETPRAAKGTADGATEGSKTGASSPSAAPGTDAAAPLPEAPGTGKAQPDLAVRTGESVGEAAAYRELDAFDFSDADADCRFGRDEEGYLLTMTPRDGSAPARFRKAYDTAVATSDITPGHNPALFRFGLWTMFNIAALEKKAVAVHSSVIRLDGRAVLFLGESGTGKSTHTRLWREHIPGAQLLNDDSPILRIVTEAPAGAAADAGANPPKAAKESDAGVRDSGSDRGCAPSATAQPGGIEILACGSPWSGKTPCYRNLSCPVAGIVRLSQAPQNHIRRLRPIEAIGALLPSCPPSFSHDERLEDAICRLISQVVAQVPVYHLACLPDADAAKLACKTIFGR